MAQTAAGPRRGLRSGALHEEQSVNDLGGAGGTTTPDVSTISPWGLEQTQTANFTGNKDVTCESNGPNGTRGERLSSGCRPTSDSFVQVPLGFLLVTGTQRLAVGSVEEAVVVERRLPVPETLLSVKDCRSVPDAETRHPSPGGIAHTQRFPLAVPSRVWDLLVSRLRALKCGCFPRPLLSVCFGRPAVSVSVSVPPAPEGHVHQTLAAGSQLWVRAPAGRGGSGFGEEAEEAEEERDGHLGVSGCVRHLEGKKWEFFI